MTLYNFLLLTIFEFFCITTNLGVSGFSCRIFLIIESLQLSEVSTDLQDSGLYNYFIILGTWLSSHELVHAIVIFQYLIQRRTIFWRHPVERLALLWALLLLLIHFNRNVKTFVFSLNQEVNMQLK